MEISSTLTAKIIPSIIKFGKFSNWGMLGRNFMKEGITLRNLVDTAYITLIYVAGAAVGTASGAWIIAGVYLIVDVTVKVTTGESISEHTAGGLRLLAYKASREIYDGIKQVESNMWRFLNMFIWY